jgi:3-oxoacyl-[acyl-carrier protein] reductase
MRVQDKSIIVTGAGSGIGAGIAMRLAAEGARVIVNDIDQDAGTRMVQAIAAEGGRARFVHADMTCSEQVRALVEATLQAHGRLDAFVNNAGWTHRNRPMLEVGEAEFDRVYAVNVKSIYLSAIHGVPAMRANPAELGPENIRVNCINPVFNPDTGLAAEFAGGPVDEARRARFLATIPLGRFSTALDVANAALYLASDEAAFISGTCIEVDGARCV